MSSMVEHVWNSTRGVSSTRTGVTSTFQLERDEPRDTGRRIELADHSFDSV